MISCEFGGSKSTFCDGKVIRGHLCIFPCQLWYLNFASMLIEAIPEPSECILWFHFVTWLDFEFRAKTMILNWTWVQRDVRLVHFLIFLSQYDVCRLGSDQNIILSSTFREANGSVLSQQTRAKIRFHFQL